MKEVRYPLVTVKKTLTVNSEPCECPKTKGIMMDSFS